MKPVSRNVVSGGSLQFEFLALVLVFNSRNQSGLLKFSAKKYPDFSRFARYIALSAQSSSASALLPSFGKSAMPILGWMLRLKLRSRPLISQGA